MCGGVKWKNRMPSASRARRPVSAGRFGLRAEAPAGAGAGATAWGGYRKEFTCFKFR